MPQKRYVFGVIAATTIFCNLPVLAQTTHFPSRPVRIIVGFLPGSSTDMFARFVGARLGERLGQQIVVDNRPGANGIIAGDLTAKANADGHTMLLMSVSHTMSAAVYQKLPYHPVKSFTPIAMLGAGPLVLVTHPSFVASGIKEVIELAKAKPNALTYATAGIGGINHFGGALFARATGVQLTQVSYKGGAPALADVIGGQVTFMWGTMPLSLAQIRAGKVKALGITSGKRSPLLPELPTIAESGVPGYEISTWWGILAPAGVAAPIVSKLNAEISAIITQPDAARRLSAEGAAPWPLSSAAYATILHSEIEKWTKVAREAGIRTD